MTTPSFHDDTRDTSLVNRVRAGDHLAFAELFTLHADALVRFVTRYVGSIDTANDIAQDVFVRAWERRQELPNTNIAAYLFRAARNRALDVLKHERVAARWEAYVVLDGLSEEPSESNMAERRLEAADVAARVRAAMAALGPRAREVVMLNREEGLAPKEIAELLGMPVTSVYVQLSRALKRLSGILRDGPGL